MDNEVLNFINRRWSKDSNWTNGNCLWFAFILNKRFPFLEIFYLPIQGHFIVGHDNVFYDWTGIYKLDESPILFSDIQRQDPTLYNRLIRDCMM